VHHQQWFVRLDPRADFFDLRKSNREINRVLRARAPGAEEKRRASDGLGVHSLEHGAVWVTYQPTLPAAQVATLQKLVKANSYALLSPYEGIKSPVVASAWGKQLALPSADDPRLAVFLRTYLQGPQTPEPGAACTGGTGTPEK